MTAAGWSPRTAGEDQSAYTVPVPARRSRAGDCCQRSHPGHDQLEIADRPYLEVADALRARANSPVRARRRLVRCPWRGRRACRFRAPNWVMGVPPSRGLAWRDGCCPLMTWDGPVSAAAD